MLNLVGFFLFLIKSILFDIILHNHMLFQVLKKETSTLLSVKIFLYVVGKNLKKVFSFEEKFKINASFDVPKLGKKQNQLKIISRLQK